MKFSLLLSAVVAFIGGQQCHADYLMTVGGLGYGNSNNLVQFHNLENPSLPQCLQGPPAYPIAPYVEGAAGGFIRGNGNDKAIVCGGNVFGPTTNACFSYEMESRVWTGVGGMSAAREQTGYEADGHWGLVISGGKSDDQPFVNTIESTMDGAVFEPMGPMPAANVRGHCMVILDNDRLFMTGGTLGPDFIGMTFVYDSITSLWTQQTDMTVPRAGPACGVTTNPTNGLPQVVVAGGFNPNVLNTVEIWQEGVWRTGLNPLPVQLQEATGARYLDTMVVVGGQNSQMNPPYLDTIYRFEPESETWTPLPNRLAQGSKYVTAFAVPEPNC